MFPTAETQSQILDQLCVHGVYVDNTDLRPINDTDSDFTVPSNVLKCSTHVEDGSLFLPYHFTDYGLEIQDLHWSHSQTLGSTFHVFPLRDPREFPSIVGQIIDLITDKGQQFE